MAPHPPASADPHADPPPRPPDRVVLFLARHGETAWNLEGRWQGQTDVALNARGRVQAAALAVRLAGRGIAHVTSSDLSRAHETATIVAARLGTGAVTGDAALRERGYGVFEGLTREECAARHPEDWARYLADRTYTPSEAEPEDAVVARMRAGVARAGALATRAQDAVLIVGHGGSIRALLTAALGLRPPPMDNGAAFRLVLTPDGLTDAEPVA